MVAPFLTLPDPKTSGEGALDPLGLGTIGDRLADTILPGFRVRMNRPRFLTVVAVAAAVCDGLDDFRGLRRLRESAGARLVCGVVLYDGQTVTRFDDRLFAVPMRLLWEDA